MKSHNILQGGTFLVSSITGWSKDLNKGSYRLPAERHSLNANNKFYKLRFVAVSRTLTF